METATTPRPTLMAQEAAESGEAVRRQRTAAGPALAMLAHGLRAHAPRAVVTLARGSSDNAATYARYLIETHLGLLTSSAAPSVASVYAAAPDLSDTLVLAVSQSGGSPDLLASAQAARARGARLVAVVNAAGSPLERAAEIVLPISAGPELSVAATKSFLAGAALLFALVAEASGDPALTEANAALPDLLEAAWALDWSPATPTLAAASHLYVVGRGHGFGVAQEVALKLKETCGFHAEAFSAAEVRHGPMALVGPDFPVLLLGQDDEALPSVRGLADEFAARGATVLHAGIGDAPGIRLPALAAHPAVQPLLLAQSFYRMADALARARGRDPDRPPHLAKVTQTL